jgi:hypothetical protein
MCLPDRAMGIELTMWLGLVLIIIVAAALAASIVSGGIFTIVVLPVAVIIAVVAAAFSLWGRASGRSKGRDRGDPAPLPPSSHRNTAPAPTTPDQIVDAKRAAQ